MSTFGFDDSDEKRVLHTFLCPSRVHSSLVYSLEICDILRWLKDRLEKVSCIRHIDSLLKSKYTAADMGTLGFEDSDVKSLLLLNRVFRVGVDQTGQYLDVEPDLRHAPLIISESGCNANTKTVSTPRARKKTDADSEER